MAQPGPDMGREVVGAFRPRPVPSIVAVVAAVALALVAYGAASWPHAPPEPTAGALAALPAPYNRLPTPAQYRAWRIADLTEAEWDPAERASLAKEPADLMRASAQIPAAEDDPARVLFDRLLASTDVRDHARSDPRPSIAPLDPPAAAAAWLGRRERTRSCSVWLANLAAERDWSAAPPPAPELPTVDAIGSDASLGAVEKVAGLAATTHDARIRAAAPAAVDPSAGSYERCARAFLADAHADRTARVNLVVLAVGSVAALLVGALYHRASQVPIAITPHQLTVGGRAFAWEDVCEVRWTPTEQGLRLASGERHSWRLVLTAGQCLRLQVASDGARGSRTARSAQSEEALRALRARAG